MKNIINRIKNDKVLFFLSILIIGVFLVLVIRVTYSYIAAFINEAREDVVIGSDTTDVFEFIPGDAIDLNVTPTTLPEGGGNYTQSTTYGASLIANSTNNTAEESYYVYFNVPENTLIYTGDNPEVILTVFQDGTEITNIDGLTYGTYNGVAGFDVTTASGLYTVASDYAITSNSSTDATIQNWTFTLTFLNQGYDQSANYGNSMSVEIIMTQKERKTTLADYVISQYTGVDGENGLYYHDADLTNGAGDNSYRYSGANPNNYVCFGSDAASCPSANLYRIIGVFGNEVKLIKSTSYGSYAWDSGNSNTWEPNSETYPDIRTTLNSTFLNTIDLLWQAKIATHEFKVGGMARDDSATAKEYYNTEVGSSSSSTTDSMKIGLMYVSDYGFAASPDYWTTELYNYEPAKSSNWLAGLTEWTISRRSDFTISAFRVNSTGYVDDGGVVYTNAVRPVFYLNSSISYVSGSGSSADPIRLN